MARTAILTVLAALALAGCGEMDDETGPGGVSAAEAKALDEAAQMLDAQRAPVEPTATANASPAAKP